MQIVFIDPIIIKHLPLYAVAWDFSDEELKSLSNSYYHLPHALKRNTGEEVGQIILINIKVNNVIFYICVLYHLSSSFNLLPHF